jgi:DNA polymerase-4
MSRIYFHIDLNAFFANAEILLDPSLKGKPLIVAGVTRRSVVSTASYEARAFGIHSAMPVSEAQHLCRDLVIVSGHYAYYEELSSQFMKLIKEYTNEIEVASIDECYADVTEKIQQYAKPLDLAWEIQKRILHEIGLPCSIGVGPNMFLAKMASDMKKPMGITVLRIRDVPEKMWPLPIGDMRGIGAKTLPLMEELQIKTIGDLANYKNIEELRDVFGKNTEEIIDRAHGHDERVIETEWESKSMGVSETMLEDVTDYEELRGMLRILSRKLSMRLKEEHKLGSRVTLRICYYDFRNADRSLHKEQPVYKTDDLFLAAMTLFDDNWDEGEAVRLLGLSVSEFMSEDAAKQLNLFDSSQEDEKAETREVLSDLNRLLGTKAFVRASSLMKGGD